MRYRAEIDGLRAFAVIPVILFHAGFETFSGGFVGVDVFFVISGYLITTIIVSELEADTFSILNFYERRARRILPALFFVVAVSIPFAWVLLLPSDMKDFSQSVAAVSLFSSNILFWKESGYFAAAAELKPLLHTWSLAVEEQYYIIFPPLLVLLWGIGKTRVAYVLFGLGVASLAAAQWASSYAPSFGFFMLPTRAFELLIGALVAFHLIEKDEIKGNSAFSFLGCVMVAYSIFAFDSQTPFPSVYALLPSLGVALIILFTSNTTIAFRLLGNKITVGIGLISYSAYLWHQPLFAFARHKIGTPADSLMIVLAATSLVLGYFSWKFVERPFRNRKGINRKTIFATGMVGSVLLIAFGIVGHVEGGWKTQWEKVHPILAALNTLLETAKNETNAQALGPCQFNTRDNYSEATGKILSCFRKHGKGVVIIGDSHAVDLFDLLTVSNKDKPFIIGFAKGYCRPHTQKVDCQYDYFLNFIRKNPDVFEYVIYEQAGFHILKTDEFQAGNRAMFSTAPPKATLPKMEPNADFISLVKAYLVDVSKYTKVVWFGSRIEPHFTQRHILDVGCDYPFALRPNQSEIFSSLDRFIEKVTHNTSIHFISQNKLFDFDFEKDFMNCDEMYWSDGDHFSAAGARRFGMRGDLFGEILE